MLLKNIRKNKKREKGIALLFSLGILGLMTVLALTFASVSMTNQTIAKNNTERYAARELANSILNRIMFSVPGGKDNVKNLTLLISKEKDGDNKGHRDWIWKLGLTGDAVESALLPLESCKSDSMILAESPTWQYVSTLDSNGDNRIVARYAYKVIGTDRPLLPINSMLLNDQNESLNKTPGTIANYQRLGMSLSELDPKYWTDTILSNPTFSSNFDYTKALEQMNLPSTTQKRRFTHYNEFAQFFDQTLSASNKQELSQFIVSRAFAVESKKFPEAFYVFDNNEGTVNAAMKCYHRFYLGRDWNNGKVGVSPKSGWEFRKELVNEMIGINDKLQDFKIDDSVENANATTTIPWLKNWTDTFAGYDKSGTNYNYPKEKQKQKQIAANIIDAFREFEKESSFDGPTSDKEPKNWLASAPEYTGNLKTPYISGIGAKIQVTITGSRVESAVDPTLYDHTFTVSPTVKTVLELANMYDKIPIQTFSYNFKGEITFKLNELDKDGNVILDKSHDFKATYDDTNLIPAASIPFSEVLKVKDRVSQVNTTKEFTIDSPTTATFSVLASPDTKITKSFSITDVVFTPRKVVLNLNHLPIDYADTDIADGNIKRPPANDGVQAIDIVSFFETAPESTVGNINILAGRRVFDPRHNLLSQEWFNESNKQQLNNEDNFDFEKSLTFNFVPLTDEKYSDKGSKDDLTPSESATRLYGNVYLPGKAITTPWELGAISRGAPWQTLNFRKYDKTKRSAETGKGGGEYKDGDLNLLDQVKVTDQAFQYGKINVNEFYDTNTELLKALFINTSNDTSTLTSPIVSDNTPPVADLAAMNLLITNLKSKLDTKRETTTPYYVTRGEFLEEFADVLAEPKANAPKQEEVFCKTAMLLEAYPTGLSNRIYVVVVAQMIRDLGGVTIYKDWNNNGKITDAAASGMGYYNAGYTFPTPTSPWTLASPPSTSAKITTQKGIYDNGADTILAEQKIFAVLEREYQTTPTEPKWKVVRMKYVE